MRHQSAEERLDILRTQIAEDLRALRQVLRYSVSRGTPEIPTPFGSLGRDAGRLLGKTSIWIAGALAGGVAGLLVSSRRPKPRPTPRVVTSESRGNGHGS
jgi:hypothetical protein